MTHRRFTLTPFVGRESERTTIVQLLDSPSNDRVSTVLISGEPGVGKTRLVEEVAGAARDRGWATFTGHCYETDGTPPFSPFVEIVESVARELPVDDLRSLLGDGAGQIARLAPDIRRLISDLPPPVKLAPEQERHFLFNRVSDFFERLSRRNSTMLIVEDLQWADDSTLVLLEHLASRVAVLPVVLLGTFRSVGLDQPLATALEHLVRRRLARRLVLRPLTRAEVEAMLGSMSQTKPPARVTETLFRGTEGNPFFVEEMFAHLTEEGVLFDEDGDWRTDLDLREADVPESVRLVLGRRLGRLSETTREILAIASVIGSTFDLTLMKAVTATSYERLLAAIDEGERAHLIAPTEAAPASGFAFVHELIRQTLILSLGTQHRRQLHLQIAGAMEELSLETRSADVAHHLYQAGSDAEVSRTVRYLTLAGDRAMKASAYEDAAKCFERALHVRNSEPDAERQRCELLLLLGTALWSAGDLDGSGERLAQAAELAKELGAGDLLAHAVLGLGEGWGWFPNERMARLLQDALDSLPEQDDALRARTMARLAVELLSAGGEDRPRRESLSTGAVSMARRLGDASTLGYTLGCWGSVFLEVADAQDRLVAATEAAHLADAGYWSTLANQQRAIALLQLGDIEGANEARARIRRRAEEPGETFASWEALRFDTSLALLEGRSQDAERLISQYLKLARGMGRFTGARLTYSVQMLLLRRMQGRVHELQAPARENAERSPQTNWVWSAALASIYCDVGLESDARDVLTNMSLDELPGLPRQRTWVLAAALLTEVCAALRDVGRSTILYEMLLPFAGRHLTSRGDGYLGAADRYLGKLADAMRKSADAERHFERAIAAESSIGARPFVAQTQYDLARLLLSRRRARDRGKARELLQRALDTANELGMARLAIQAQTLMDSPTSLAPSHPAGLSEREVDVLRRLAQGRSSREIAGEFILTTRTVERHITNIYRKIDVHNRAQATAFAIEHRLTQDS